MPDSQEEFDAEWARIVDDLTSGSPGTAPRPPGATDATEQPPAPPAEGTGTGRGASEGLDALFEPLRRRRKPEPAAQPAPDDFVDNWEDEGHFVPPPPPDIPEGTPLTRLAWAGVIGGPVILLLIAFTGWAPPGIVAIGAGVACLAGFATLVWHLPEGREDGWDDGAQL